MEKANLFLKEKYLPTHNARFAVKPASDDSAFVPWLDSNLNLDEILCIQETRIVNKDNTVSYKNRKLQIQPNQFRNHYVKKRVTVHENENGDVKLYFGPRCLGKYPGKIEAGNERAVAKELALA